MFQKFATLEVLDVKSAPKRVSAASLTKFADFDEYRTDDGYVYVRVRAISSRVNKNNDGWPSSELKKSYKTFIGKPIFVDHHNSDPKKARGVIVDAALHIEDAKTSGLDPYYASAPAEHLPPTWIELLLEVDAKRFPRLAKAIVDGDIDGVSMGANVEISKCSHCGNEATSPEQYCKHVASKGAYFDFYESDGTKTSKKAYEDCYKIGFFEISFVFDPADETALVSDIKHASRMARIAAVQNEAEAEYGNFNKTAASFGDYFDENQQAGRSLPLPYNQESEGALICPECQGNQVDMMSGRCMNCGAAYQKGVKANPVEDLGGGQRQQQAAIPMAFENDQHRWEASIHPIEMDEMGFYEKIAERAEKPQSDMVSAPQSVDTLRQEQVCPICGSDMDDGVCEVCNYEEPPEGFDNPDLNKAKEVDEQMKQQQAEQAAQGNEPAPADVQPGPGGPPPAMPSGMQPATSNVDYSDYVRIEDKTSAQQGRINTQERPILPATRQLSDKPIRQKTVSEAKKPVQSNSTKENMTDTVKTADGASAQGEGVAPDKRVDVEGIGAVTGDPLSGIEHENVEKDTGDFTAPHTDTWSGNEGDSLGQQDAVTSDTGDFFTVSKDVTGAEAEDNAGDDIGDGGGSAKAGGPTWDSSDGGFPDHQPARVDLLAPLKEEVGESTKTDPDEKYRSLKEGDPVTKDGNGNDVGGPIGVAVASAKAQVLAALKLAETEIELGLITADSKYERIAELEGTSAETIEAQLTTLAKVKTAGLKKGGTAKTAGAGRMPSFKPVTSSMIDIEANSTDGYETDDVIGW